MELGVSHVQNLSPLPPVVDNIFDKYNNKNLVPIRSLSDHDISIGFVLLGFFWCFSESSTSRERQSAALFFAPEIHLNVML